MIPLRSGNGGLGGSDPGVLVEVSDRATTAGDAESLARVLEADDDAARRLATDPAARWIGPAPGVAGEGRIVSYRIPFTVNAGPVASAEVTLVAMARGLWDAEVVADVVLNDRRVGAFWLTARAESEFVVEDVGSALGVGANVLSLNVPHGGVDGGLIFSGRVSVWRAAEVPGAASVADAAEGSGVAGGATAAGIGVDCVGFACRPRGDLDSDYDVDGDDYDRFSACVGGVGMAAPAGCEYADFECDGKVDLLDAAAFQIAFTGSF